MQRSTSCSHCHDNHRACATVEYLRQVTAEFVSADFWPPNSPDLNPVDYRVWGFFRTACIRNAYVTLMS